MPSMQFAAQGLGVQSQSGCQVLLQIAGLATGRGNLFAKARERFHALLRMHVHQRTPLCTESDHFKHGSLPVVYLTRTKKQAGSPSFFDRILAAFSSTQPFLKAHSSCYTFTTFYMLAKWSNPGLRKKPRTTSTNGPRSCGFINPKQGGYHGIPNR